eukprot:386746_1
MAHIELPLKDTGRTNSGITDIDFERIGQIMLDHEFISNVSVINSNIDEMESFCQKEDIQHINFRKQLVISWSNINDEGTILWQLCCQVLHYTKKQRECFYDILLHSYFSLDDMSTSDLIYILKKLIHELLNGETQNINFKNISKILDHKNVNGLSFQIDIIDSESFAKFFKSIKNMSKPQWEIIFNQLIDWKSRKHYKPKNAEAKTEGETHEIEMQQFDKPKYSHDTSLHIESDINWDRVGQILWEYDFLNDQNLINEALDSLETYCHQEKIGIETLTKQLCDVYGSDTEKK